MASQSTSNLGSSASSQSPPSSSASPSPDHGDSSSAPHLSSTPTPAAATPSSSSGPSGAPLPPPPPTSLPSTSGSPSTSPPASPQAPSPPIPLTSPPPSYRYAVIAPFSRDRPLRLLPPVIDPTDWHKALALIEFSPDDYTVVVVSPDRRIHTQTYESRTGRWEQRGDIRLSSSFIDLETAAWHQGLLFCVTRSPNHFLTFDLISGQWRVLELDFPMPSLFSSHLVVYGGELYLTAKVRDRMDSRIGIWKLDQSAMAWREFDFMPDDYSPEVDVGVVAHCSGIICFGNFSSKKTLMCDLVKKRWWWSQPCTVPTGEHRGLWVGHTIEPHIDLLK